MFSTGGYRPDCGMKKSVDNPIGSAYKETVGPLLAQTNLISRLRAAFPFQA